MHWRFDWDVTKVTGTRRSWTILRRGRLPTWIYLLLTISRTLRRLNNIQTLVDTITRLPPTFRISMVGFWFTSSFFSSTAVKCCLLVRLSFNDEIKISINYHFTCCCHSSVVWGIYCTKQPAVKMLSLVDRRQAGVGKHYTRVRRITGPRTGEHVECGIWKRVNFMNHCIREPSRARSTTRPSCDDKLSFCLLFSTSRKYEVLTRTEGGGTGLTRAGLRLGCIRRRESSAVYNSGRGTRCTHGCRVIIISRMK
jgi:hypothetical protein